MNEAEIRKYAMLMQELGLTGLEVKENVGVVRLERAGAAAPDASAAAAEPVAAQSPATRCTRATDGIFKFSRYIYQFWCKNSIGYFG